MLFFCSVILYIKSFKLFILIMENKIKEVLKNKKLLYIIGGVLLALIAIAVLLFFFLKKEKTYAITFDTDGGSAVEQVVVKEGESVTLPTEPTKEGFRFNGWLLDGQPFAPSTKITEDVKLVASWIAEDAVTFKVTFTPDNGNPAIEVEVEENTAVAKPTDPTKDKATFKGWFLNDVEYDFAQLVTGDITLVAKWDEVKVEEKKETPKVVAPGKVEVTGVTLNKTSLTLNKGASETLVATVLPTNATNKAVTWSSSNAGVATVSNGTVTAVASGSAVITVKTADGKSAIANVTVTNPVTGLKITYNRTYLYQGDAALKTATPVLQYLPADADPSSKGIVAYRGSGNIGGPSGAISLISGTGVVTATNTPNASTNKIWAEMGGIKSNEVTIITEYKLSLPTFPGCQDITLQPNASRSVSFNTGSNVSISSNNPVGISASPLSGSSTTVRAGAMETDMTPVYISVTSYAGQKGCINVHVRTP